MNTPPSVRLLAAALLLLVGAFPSSAQPRAPQAGGFVENKGQWPDRARYLLRGPGSDVWVEDDAIVHDLYRIDDGNRRVGCVTRMRFVGSGGQAIASGDDTLPGFHNYLLGADSSRWTRDAYAYDRVSIAELYPGIDLRVVDVDGFARYDLDVYPNGDPSSVRIAFEGADRLEVDSAGNLLVHTPFGTMLHRGLQAYQGHGAARRSVECRFVVEPDNGVRFDVGEYDRTRPLVIDPLVFSTLVGASATDHAYAFALDAAGNSYVGGWTDSPDFPVTTGAYDRSFGGASDIYVSKLSSDGTTLLYSTYIGGASDDRAYDLVVDRAGSVHLVGGTFSSDFPTTPGAYDATLTGGQDAVIVRLSADGSTLVASTLIGGSESENAPSVAVDSSGGIYLKGFTFSDDFPTTPGAYRTSLPVDEFETGYLSKFDPSLTTLVYSTFYYGAIRSEAIERGRTIEVDRSGNAYIVGTAYEDGPFESTAGAFDPTLNGANDVYVMKFNSAGTNVDYSTLIGGSGDDVGGSILLDPSGVVYLTGKSSSTDFPTTPGAAKRALDGASDAWVARLNASGSLLQLSTYLGGRLDDGGNGIGVDRAGNIFVTGYTTSTDFPTTGGAHDPDYNGGGDLFISKLLPDGSVVLYSTYFGGGGEDIGEAIVVRNDSDVYVAGTTLSSNFPVTAGSYDATYNGAQDAFVLKLGLACSLGLPSSPDARICVGDSVRIGVDAVGGDGPYLYRWSPGVGLSDSTIARPNASPDTTITYTLTVIDGKGCVAVNSYRVVVSGLPSVEAGADTAVCSGGSVVLRATPASGTPPYTITWSPAAGLDRVDSSVVVASPSVTTVYRVTLVDANGCGASVDSLRVVVHPPVQKPTITRSGQLLLSSSAAGYQWFFGADPLPNDTLQTLLPRRPGRYAVSIVDVNGCAAISDFIDVEPNRFVRFDTVNGRVGEPLRMTMRIAPSLHDSDSFASYTAWVRLEPRSLFPLAVHSPDSASGERATIDFDPDGRGRVMRAVGSPSISGDVLFQLELMPLVTAVPRTVVTIDSVVVEGYGRLGVLGNGLALLEGCDVSNPIVLDKPIAITMITPHPISNTATVRYRGSLASEPTLHVRDMTGRVVLIESLPSPRGGEAEASIDLRSLSSGLYRLELRDRQETSAVTVVVVR